LPFGSPEVRTSLYKQSFPHLRGITRGTNLTFVFPSLGFHVFLLLEQGKLAEPYPFPAVLLLRSRENQGLLPLAFGFPLGEN
jgi:hypothetical protein